MSQRLADQSKRQEGGDGSTADVDVHVVVLRFGGPEIFQAQGDEAAVSGGVSGADQAKARRSGGTVRTSSKSMASIARIARPVIGKVRPNTTAAIQSPR